MIFTISILIETVIVLIALFILRKYDDEEDLETRTNIYFNRDYPWYYRVFLVLVVIGIGVFFVDVGCLIYYIFV